MGNEEFRSGLFFFCFFDIFHKFSTTRRPPSGTGSPSGRDRCWPTSTAVTAGSTPCTTRPSTGWVRTCVRRPSPRTPRSRAWSTNRFPSWPCSGIPRCSPVAPVTRSSPGWSQLRQRTPKGLPDLLATRHPPAGGAQACAAAPRYAAWTIGSAWISAGLPWAMTSPQSRQ